MIARFVDLGDGGGMALEIAATPDEPDQMLLMRLYAEQHAADGDAAVTMTTFESSQQSEVTKRSVTFVNGRRGIRSEPYRYSPAASAPIARPRRRRAKARTP